MSDENVITALIVGLMYLVLGIAMGFPAWVVVVVGALLMLVLLYGDNK